MFYYNNMMQSASMVEQEFAEPRYVGSAALSEMCDSERGMKTGLVGKKKVIWRSLYY